MKRGITILILILILPIVLAQSIPNVQELMNDNPEQAEQIINNYLTQFKQEFNEQEFPGALKKLSGKEKVNLITTSLTISAEIKNLNIESIQTTKMEDSTLDILMSDETFEQLSSKQKTLPEAIKDGSVTYDAKRIRTKLKMRIILLIL